MDGGRRVGVKEGLVRGTSPAWRAGGRWRYLLLDHVLDRL